MNYLKNINISISFTSFINILNKYNNIYLKLEFFKIYQTVSIKDLNLK